MNTVAPFIKFRLLWLIFTLALCLPYSSHAQLKFKHLTINQGLSQNSVLCMWQDREGFVWIGTEDGLNRYDGYEFKHYKHDDRNKKSISSSFINSIIEDAAGNLWIATADGLNVYNKRNDEFIRISTTSPKALKLNLNRDFINSLFLDDKNNIWIGTIEGLKKYDLTKKQLFDFAKFPTENGIDNGNRPQAIFKDNLSRLWVGTTNELQCYNPVNGHKIALPQAIAHLKNQYIRIIKQDHLKRIWFGSEANGVYVYNPADQSCINYSRKGNVQNSLPGNTLRDIFFKSDNEVWIGTLEGLGILNLSNGEFSNQIYNPENENGISHNSVRNFLKDNAGNIWLGTYAGGINIYYPNSLKFDLISEKTARRNGLSHPVVSSILEDKNGNFWIGTETGGLNYYDKSNGTFSSYYINSAERGTHLLNNLIKSLAKRDDDHFWVGTYNGLSLFSIKAKTFVNYNVADKNLLGSNQIYALVNTTDGLWIGTNGGGLRFLNNNNQLSVFLHHNDDGHSISSNNINTIVKDDDNNLWIGTRLGLNYFNTKTKQNTAYYHHSAKPHSLSSNAILSIYIDTKKRIWIGTEGGGLNLFNSRKNEFHNIIAIDEMGNDMVHAITEDADGYIWISTNKGLSRIGLKGNEVLSDKDISIATYTVEDGLQSNQFSTGAVAKSKNGDLYFGGIKGVSWFNPQGIKSNKLKPNIAFTEILIKDKKFNDYREDGQGNGEMILPYDHGSITFKFTALNFITPEKNRYAYRLEGLANDEDWHYVGANQRLATYTNLTTGTYYFRLKAANNDGLWNNKERVIKITVLPPYWKTWWAYLIYTIVIGALLYLFYYYSLKTAKLKNELHYEHLNHQKDQELAEQKINFFTNISHEIKTPLTLILAPLDKMIKGSRDNSKGKSQLLMMQRNGERLNRLISQLLDFRKFESGNMLLKNTENDLVLFLKEICVVFESYASQQHKSLKFHSIYDTMPLWFDEDKLEKIMYNLLSNAIKFTHNNGQIQVHLKPDELDVNFVNITVEDNGVGISEKDLQNIFSQFKRSEEPNLNSSGTGIGLAFSKGLATLLGGQLLVQSRKQKGNRAGHTCFTVKLPLLGEYLQPKTVQEDVVEQAPITTNILKKGTKIPTEKATLLVVEDNKDLLDFMSGALAGRYVVYTATNGKEGMDKLREITPDIILSDVMMPEMDGIAFCKKVKSAIKTSHIPFILLTARTPEIYKIEGFEIGADDYITKPFSMEVLEARIENLLASRSKLIAHYKTELNTQPQQIDITSPDEVLIAKVMSFIERNLAEPALNVEEMAKEIGIGRSALYRKIKALTGKTAIEFIRTSRIKQAAQLLKQKKMNINEVVYSVGFTDVDYFRRCFKEEFGMTPKEYANTGG